MLHLMYTFILEFWNTLCEMAPYLLFGFGMAGALSVFLSSGFVASHLGGKGQKPIWKAALFGVPLPLCSCGVIPVAASLRRSGAGKAATTAFLLSTPQTGVDSILVTYSLLGPVLALFRPLAALLTGCVGGNLVGMVSRDEAEMATGHIPDKETSERRRGWLKRALYHGFVLLPRDLARTLSIGLFAAALISVAVPERFFEHLPAGGLGSMFLAMLVGIPLYVCASASVPIAAILMAKGVSAGAAVVFLMTGPVTNAAAIAAIWKMLGRKATFVYLATVAGCAFLLGGLLDLVYTPTPSSVPALCHQAERSPGPLGIASALALVGLLGYAMLSRRPEASQGSSEMGGIQLTIRGMTCDHCSSTVREILEGCPGVTNVVVDRARGVATVNGEGVDPAMLCKNLEMGGFTASVS